MGVTTALNSTVGSVIDNMQKFLIASCLAAAALAAPEADPAVLLGNALVGTGGVAPAWPSAVGYGVQSTCFGCRPYHGIGKREAEPYYGYGLGVAAHPGHATSYVGPTVWGAPHHFGKRSAQPHGYGVGVGIANNNIHGLSHFGSGYGISQLHPTGHSFQHINRLHKREADAEAEATPEAEAEAAPEADAYYGYYGHGYGHGDGLGYGHHGGYYGHGYGHGYGYGYYG